MHRYDACNVQYQVFDDNASLAKKLPMVKLKSGERGIYNADAWLVLASECLSAFYTCSAKNGATVIENDGVASIDRKKRIVVTNSGVIVRKSLL